MSEPTTTATSSPDTERDLESVIRYLRQTAQDQQALMSRPATWTWPPGLGLEWLKDVKIVVEALRWHGRS